MSNLGINNPLSLICSELESVVNFYAKYYSLYSETLMRSESCATRWVQRYSFRGSLILLTVGLLVSLPTISCWLDSEHHTCVSFYVVVLNSVRKQQVIPTTLVPLLQLWPYFVILSLLQSQDLHPNKTVHDFLFRSLPSSFWYCESREDASSMISPCSVNKVHGIFNTRVFLSGFGRQSDNSLYCFRIYGTPMTNNSK